jgi:hypothetical protein
MHMPLLRRAESGFYGVAPGKHAQCLDGKSKRYFAGRSGADGVTSVWKSDTNIALLLTALSTAQISIWWDKEKSQWARAR